MAIRIDVEASQNQTTTTEKQTYKNVQTCDITVEHAYLKCSPAPPVEIATIGINTEESEGL